MKRVIFGIAITIISPVLFLFLLISALSIYRTNYHTNLVALKNVNKVAYAALPTAQNNFSASVSISDSRTEIVKKFLAKYDSPLEPYAQDVVDAADEYGLDYRLVPAIAMQESNLCNKIPAGSNNCWGYGIYGGKVHKFENYKEAIYTVTKTLATKYKSRGLETPDQIMTMWTPSSNGSWAFSVNHFMEKLN